MEREREGASGEATSAAIDSGGPGRASIGNDSQQERQRQQQQERQAKRLGMARYSGRP